MKMSAGRNVIGALVVSGFTAVAALTGAGAAAAAPLDSPLINSTCSYAQIDRAMRAEHPDMAAKMDANPQRKAMMQRLFSMPVPQRKAEIQQYMQQHPDQVNKMRQWQAAHPAQVNQHRAMASQVANTCHNY